MLRNLDKLVAMVSPRVSFEGGYTGWSRQLLFVCVAMRGRRACRPVESGMSVLLVGSRRAVSEVGEVLRWYGPGRSVLFRSGE